MLKKVRPDFLHALRLCYSEAKRNVDRYYAVVGVLEEFEKSIRVLEAFIPRYFKGASETFLSMPAVNKNIYRPKVSLKTKQLVRKNMTKEYEFYNYCRQRLHKQYLAAKIY